MSREGEVVKVKVKDDTIEELMAPFYALPLGNPTLDICPGWTKYPLVPNDQGT